MAIPTQGEVLAGKYQVERVLGQGGMGMVVAARHLELGQRVAIKFLLGHVAVNEIQVARFLREGRAAAQIQSEHVGRVFDVGRLESGEPYLVMEYLHGRDLGMVVQQDGPLAVPLAVDLVLQAAEAIAQAHAMGVLHRDLKPANLFLTQRADESPLVKVIDFGISKVSASAPDAAGGATGVAGEAVDMTTTASVMGSPLYMPPEQMRSARDVDARCDVWGLGGILYVLLTGAPPFPGKSMMEIYDLMQRGMPPMRRADVAGTLEAAVARCLARDPNDRFADVAELAAALAPFGSDASRASAQRIARVLRRTTSQSGPRTSARPISTTGASRAHSAEGPAGASVTGVSSWARTPRGRGPAVALVVVAGALTVAVAGWAIVRARTAGEVEPEPPGAATAATAASPVDAVQSESQAAAAPPSGSPAATGADSALAPTAQPSASASASAGGVGATPKARPQPPPAGKPSSRPKASAQPPDLFGDPR